MQSRISVSRVLFHVGLVIVLGAGIVSGTSWSPGATTIAVLMAGGALLAVLARVGYALSRRSPMVDIVPGLTGADRSVLRQAGFFRRRPAA